MASLQSDNNKPANGDILRSAKAENEEEELRHKDGMDNANDLNNKSLAYDDKLRWWKKLKGGGDDMVRCWRKIKDEMKNTNWRRVAHSAKVGLALALVSLSVLLQDVSKQIGPNALWAILTVVVVFEYTVGATLSKGLNRGLGTIMAASLGLFVDYMANFTGAKVEPFVVGFSVFVVGMMATYTRFVPSIKAKYDYGVVIFLLTFCLVVISGYKVSDNIDVVFDRIVTVMVGVIICMLVSIFIFPIWAGDDMHNLVTQNFEGLANSLEECLKEYFQGVQKLSRVSSKICKGQPYDDKIYKGYRGVLISKQTEESLATFASWEPRRGRFGCIYPWKRLVEVGAILRHCAYTVSALHGCVLSEIQAPESLKKVFASTCMRVGEEVASVLRGVASDLKAKRRTKPKYIVLRKVRLVVEDLNYAVRTYPHFLITSHLQNPNLNPNFPTHNFNDISTLQEPTFISQTPFVSHDIQSPSCHSPHLNLKPSSDHILSPNPNPTLKPSLDLSSILHLPSNSTYKSHQNLFPKSTTNVSAYPLLNPNLNPSSYPNPRNDIEAPNLDQNSRHHSNLVVNPNPSSNFLCDVKPTTPMSLPPTSTVSTNGNMKMSLMLHGSMEFAESLSLASLITLLIEIVARVEHLLDTNAEFQEQACFQNLGEDEEEELAFVDINIEDDQTRNRILHSPLSTAHVE